MSPKSIFVVKFRSKVTTENKSKYIMILILRKKNV